MSKVRVLVGTRKGAFVLTSDGKRQQWDVSGPHFAGWEIYHLKGSPADPEPALCFPVERLVRAADPALQRRRQDLGAVGNKFVYDGVPGTHQWYDGTPHPWEFKRVWHLEPSLHRPGYGATPGWKMPPSSAPPMAGRTGRNWPVCAATARAPTGSPAPAACACTPSSSIPPTPCASTSPSPPPAPSAPTMAARPGSPSTRDCAPSTSPTPMPRSATASTTWPCIPRVPTCSSCRSTGTSCAAITPAICGTKSAATCPPISAS